MNGRLIKLNVPPFSEQLSAAPISSQWGWLALRRLDLDCRHCCTATILSARREPTCGTNVCQTPVGPRIVVDSENPVSIKLKLLLCLAKTGEYAPGTMFLNRRDPPKCHFQRASSEGYFRGFLQD